MEVGGYKDVPDWSKMGPSLLIATCLVVAIRTAKWSATIDARNSNCELNREIDFAAQVANADVNTTGGFIGNSVLLAAKVFFMASESAMPSKEKSWLNVYTS